MEHVKINEKAYGYVVDFKNNDLLRKSFNELMMKTYRFNLEECYQNGYLGDRYIPYSIIYGDNVVSNVSVNIMDFYYMEEKMKFIQIGTVMTDKEYRNQGLNRYLMEKVLEEWKDKCDLIYLFANNTVLEFYPKFGFVPVKEYQYSKEIHTEKTTSNIVKLDMSIEKDKNLLMDTVKESVHFAKLSIRDSSSTMFYCTSFMKENVCFVKDFNAIAVAEFKDNMVYLNDVYCKKDVLLDDIIKAMITKDNNKVVLGFTPKDTKSYNQTVLHEENTTLFILDDKKKVFDSNRIMFPVLSHA